MAPSKIEITREARCEAHQFYGIFKDSLRNYPLPLPFPLPEAFPKSYKSCEVLEDDGSGGTIRRWKYVMSGKTKVLASLEKPEVLDDEKVLIILNIYEGRHTTDYPHSKLIVHVTPKGQVCSVKWTTECEKGHEVATDPPHYMEVFGQVVENCCGLTAV